GAHVATVGGSRASAIAVAERLYPAPTEGTHPAGEAIAGGDTATLLRLMQAEERAGVEAVGRVLPEVERAVEAISTGLRRGGRLHYFGAGSSGRLAALDALECPATLGIDAERVVAHLAGDDEAEDDRELGARDADALAPGGR